MSWSELGFGKHRRRTLPQVMFCDADWFYWLHANPLLTNNYVRGSEVEDIYRKSRSIKVPQRGDEQLVAEYIVDPRRHNFRGLDLVPISRPPHQGYSQTFRLPIIDMAKVWEIAKYDKGGYQRLISDLKLYLFGSRRVRMTKQRCEAFFDDDANFALAAPAQH